MLIVFLLALFGFILLSVPIAFSLVLTAVVLMLYTGDLSFSVISQSLIRGIDNFHSWRSPLHPGRGDHEQGRHLCPHRDLRPSLVGHISGGLASWPSWPA